MDHLDLAPITRLAGTVRLPGSKSISNRVLLLAALAQGDTLVRDLLDSDDAPTSGRARRVEWSIVQIQRRPGREHRVVSGSGRGDRPIDSAP